MLPALRFPARCVALLRWLLCAGLTFLLLSVGCGGDVYLPLAGGVTDTGTAGNAAPPVLSAPAGPVVLTALSPAVVQAGSAAATITVSAAGIAAGATVLVDGANHSATLRSSGLAVLTLSRAELATGTRHTIAIQNVGTAASNPETLLVTGGHWAFGDSITYGYGLPNPSTGNYAYLLATAYRLTFVNSAKSGDQACDVWAQLYRSAAGYTAQAAPLFSLMIGTNDVDVKGTGAYESVFTACDLAALSWLGTPRTAKVIAGDAALSASGTCSSTASASLLGTAACSGGPGTVTATLSTSGNPIYVWYLLSDSASPGDGVSLALDGTAQGTFTTRATVPVATANGGTQGMAVVRLPAAPGSHTVSINTTGLAGVLGIGSNPSTGADHPRLLVGDLPNQAYGSPVAPIASQLVYVGHTTDIEQLLQSDDMDVHRALTRTYMLGTVYEMADQLHPNAVGQLELEKAFDASLP